MRRAALLLVPATALLLAACAGAPPAATPTIPGEPARAPATAPAPVPKPSAPAGAPPFAALAARFRERALEQEQAGEPRRALESWRVVAALRPDAAEPRRRVEELGARLSAEAARRYEAGMARLGNGEIDAARRELLLALAADPGHAAALDALKNRLEPPAATHTVAAGETFEDIAGRYYGDAAKAALIARLNDLDPAGRPAPGAVILVPSLAPATAKPAPSAKPAQPAAEPAEARDSGYETEPATIDHEGAPGPPPGAAPSPAPSLAPAPAAPAAAPSAPPKPDPAEPQRRREKAEQAYTAGVRFFINQQLDEAIRSWELTLSLNPEHPKAAKDIEKARALQQKLRDIR